MLLSCTKCNSAKYKGAKFPSDAEGGPLINPSVDEPAKHFDFVYDPKTKTARVRPTSNRGTITEITLGLNRLELLKMRSEVLRRLICIRINADADPEAKAIINDALSHNGAYMAFMKKYLAP